MRSFFWINNMAELVKFYENTMTGIPQLANVQGSMINLLDAILVNGFNEKVITSIVRDGGTAVLSFNNAHGFLERQVVSIAGTTNGWNGEYRIISLTPTTLTIECSEALPVNSEGTASCKAAAMGFEILFTGINKRAYRSLNPESLGLILRVVDEPRSTPAGVKFAKVGVVSSMSDIDTITGAQMPFDLSNPNANWQLTGNYDGWAKWYYAIGSTTLLSEDSTPGAFNRVFTVSGNSLGFFVHLINHADAEGIYGCAEFYDSVLKSKNLCLMASGILDKIANNANYIGHAISAVKYNANATVVYAGTRPQALCWFNTQGLIESIPITMTPQIGGGLNSNANTTFCTNFVCAPFALISNNVCLGTLPFLKIQLSSLNGMGIYGSGRYRAVFKYSDPVVLKFALNLEEE